MLPVCPPLEAVVNVKVQWPDASASRGVAAPWPPVYVVSMGAGARARAGGRARASLFWTGITVRVLPVAVTCVTSVSCANPCAPRFPNRLRWPPSWPCACQGQSRPKVRSQRARRACAGGREHRQFPYLGSAAPCSQSASAFTSREGPSSPFQSPRSKASPPGPSQTNAMTLSVFAFTTSRSLKIMWGPLRPAMPPYRCCGAEPTFITTLQQRVVPTDLPTSRLHRRRP